MNNLEHRVRDICEKHASDYSSGMSGFIKDLHHNGFTPYILGELIYYYDTNKFYDEFENEIWDVIRKNGNNIMKFISSLSVSNDTAQINLLKNMLVRFAFEKIAFQLFDQ